MKQWNCLQISLDSRNLDQITGILWELGTQGIEECPKPNELCIKAYFDRALDIRLLTKTFKARSKNANLAFHAIFWEVEGEQDWFRKWREGLKPFAVGRKFYVFPCKDRTRCAPAGRLPVWLEPGMAFGTGTHETTQLCLEVMEDYLTPGTSFLDVGTGSGILALGAAKLGAQAITACDSDSVAIGIARSNAAVNRCASRLRLVSGDIRKVRQRQFDVVAANLTLEIIEESLSQMERRLHSGGILILSGILVRQLSRLRPQLSKAAFSVIEKRKKGEWACLVLRRQSDPCRRSSHVRR